MKQKTEKKVKTLQDLLKVCKRNGKMFSVQIVLSACHGSGCDRSCTSCNTGK